MQFLFQNRFAFSQQFACACGIAFFSICSASPETAAVPSEAVNEPLQLGAFDLANSAPSWQSLQSLQNQALSFPSRQVGLPDLSQLADPSWLLSPGDLLGDGRLTFYLDNDMFGGGDENYTNGTRFSWISDDLPRNALPKVQNFLSRVSEPLRWESDQPSSYSFGVSLTQLMFTPEDISLREPNPEQRPYAGWLGLGFSVHSKTESSLDSFELAFGLTGQYSLAETSQDFIHSLKGVEKAQGWNAQIPTELTLNLHYTHQQLLFSLGDYDDPFRAEFIGKYGADIGNFRTQARVGADLRFGYNLPPEFTYNAVSMNAYSHQLFGKAREQRGDFSLFSSFGAEARASAWDITLDGTLFSDSPNVNKKIFVGEVYGSVGARWKNWTLSYRQALRTKEYKTQSDNQVFGSLSLSLEF